MQELLSIVAGLVAFGSYALYAIDILKGRAQPARSSRFMFVVLLAITMLQQGVLHSGWLIAVTVGELVGSVAILVLSVKHGVGGLSRLDMACYALIVVDMLLWLTSGNALLALHLSVLADLIAFTPTLALRCYRSLQPAQIPQAVRPAKPCNNQHMQAHQLFQPYIIHCCARFWKSFL